MSQQAQVVEVQINPRGSTLVGAHSAGATSITVKDATPFDDAGTGQLVIDGEVYDWTAESEIADASDPGESNAVLTITPGLATDEPDLMPVSLWASDQVLDDLQCIVTTGAGQPFPITVTGQQRKDFSALEGADFEPIGVEISDDQTAILDYPGYTPMFDGRAAAPGTTQPAADGVAPGIPQNVTTVAARGLVFVRWSPIALNADGDTQQDAARYRVYVGAAGDTTVAPDDAHLLGETAGTMIAASTLADGTPLAYEDTDGTVLSYPFAVSAVDNDGEGDPADAVLGHMDKTGAADLVVADVLAAVVEAITVRGEVLSTRARDATTGDLIGPGWTMGSTSITEYDQSGTPQTSLQMGISNLVGDALIGYLNVALGATFDGDVTMSPGTTFRLGGGAAGVADPTNPPTFSTGYSTLQYTKDGNWGDRCGWSTDGTYWYTARTIYVHGVGNSVLVEKWNASGVLVDSGSVGFGSTMTVTGSCVGPGGDLYVIANTGSTWGVYQFSASTMDYLHTNVLSGTTAQEPDGFSRGCALGFDSVAGELLIAQSRSTNSDKVRIRRYTYTTGSTFGTWGSFFDTTFGYAQALSYILYGSFDLGVTRYLFGNFVSASRAIDTSGNRQTTEEWPDATGGMRGMGWDGTSFVAMSNTGVRYTYEAGTGNRWTTSTDATWYAAYAWTGSGTQSKTSNYVTIPMVKRAQLTLVSPAIPTGATGVTHYLSKGSSAPNVTTTSMRSNGTGTTLLVTNATFSSPDNPTTNTFAVGSASQWQSTEDDVAPNAFAKSDGSWQLSGLSGGVGVGPGTYMTYTPALTATTTNPNLGSTGTITGEYTLIGDVCIGTVTATFGGTGINAGSGRFLVTIPVAAHASRVGKAAGDGSVNDASAGLTYTRSVVLISSTTAQMNEEAPGAVGAATPITPAAGDVYTWNYAYRVATSVTLSAPPAPRVEYVAESLTGVWIGTQEYDTFENAVNAANAAGGGRIFFLGDITPAALPVITSSNIHITGGGWGKSILRAAPGATEILRLGSKTSGSAINGLNLSDFRMVGDTGVTIGLNIIGVQFSLFSNLRVDTLADTGAIGIVLDTQSTGAFVSSINNTFVGGFITGCYHGVKLTRDAAKTTAVGLGTSADDGANHNTFVGTRGAVFSGIGFDVDHGENVKAFGIDFSTATDGATGIRINDDVCLLSSPRADNSFGVGNTATGIHLTANASDHYITNPTGNGPTTRMLYDDKTITGHVVRQSFTVQVGNVRRSQVATGSDFWFGRAWKNISASTISASEIGWFDSTCGEGEVKRGAAASTCTNPMVAVESITASSTGAFAEAGSVVSVKVDALAVAIGDQLVPSTTVNGAVKTDNTNTNPRLIVGRARTSIAAGNSGSTIKVYIR